MIDDGSDSSNSEVRKANEDKDESDNRNSAVMTPADNEANSNAG